MIGAWLDLPPVGIFLSLAATAALGLIAIQDQPFDSSGGVKPVPLQELLKISFKPE